MRVCWAQWVFMVLVAFMGITQMLTACGNKGPLYLPTDEQIAELEKKKSSTDVTSASTEDELDRLEAQEEKGVKKDKVE